MADDALPSPNFDKKPEGSFFPLGRGEEETQSRGGDLDSRMMEKLKTNIEQ